MISEEERERISHAQATAVAKEKFATLGEVIRLYENVLIQRLF